MKFVRYNEISLYVNFLVELQGRQVKVKWTSEDGLLEHNFYEVFKDLTDEDYEKLELDFHDFLPTFDIEMKEYENA